MTKNFKEIIQEQKITIKGTPLDKHGKGLGAGYTYVIHKKDVTPKDDKYQMYIYYKNKPYLDMGSHPQKTGIPFNRVLDNLKKFTLPKDKKMVKKMMDDIQKDKDLLGI